MPQPRLLLVLTEFPPSFGGMQTHAVYLCRHLHERGYPIAVATYRAENASAFDASLSFPVHRVLSRIGYWHNLDAIGKLVGSFHPDAVYSSTVFHGQAVRGRGVPVLCRSAGNDVLRPWIAWPYRPGSGMVSAPWFEDRVYRRWRRLEWPERFEAMLLAERRAVMTQSAAYMQRVLANSEYTAGLLESIDVRRERVRVLPGGVDAPRFNPPGADRARLRSELGLPPRKYLLMTACRIVAKKGIHLLLGALPQLLRRMPDVHLVVVGDGRDRSRSEALAAELNVSDAVTFTGVIGHDQLHRYYWSADQFVLASIEHLDTRTGLRDVETMGRVLCEANASGVPVVASRSGGIPSVIEHEANGLLFEERSPGEMLNQMERIRSDATLAGRLRDNGLRRARSAFDWPVICQAHEDEFRAVTR